MESDIILLKLKQKDAKLLSIQTVVPSSDQIEETAEPSLEKNSADVEGVSFDFNDADLPTMPKAEEQPQGSPVNLGADIEENIPFKEI